MPYRPTQAERDGETPKPAEAPIELTPEQEHIAASLQGEDKERFLSMFKRVVIG